MKSQSKPGNATGRDTLESALSLLPRACYLMTVCHDDQRGGMLVSSVQVCCTAPAMICVAARKGHAIDPLIRDARTFAIGVVKPDDKLIQRRFARNDGVPSEHKHSSDDGPFDSLPYKSLVTGAPILERCPTWFDCEVMRRVDLESESELFVGLVIAVSHEGTRQIVDRGSEER